MLGLKIVRIYNGLTDVMKHAPEGSAVMIHDAARPLLTEELINRCFDSLGCHDGVMPVLPMKDTVYFSEEGKTIDSLLNRNKIYDLGHSIKDYCKNLCIYKWYNKFIEKK